MRLTRTVIGPLAAVLVAAVLATPATATTPRPDPPHTGGSASRVYHDLRSPDARAAAEGRADGKSGAPVFHDLVSPDARDVPAGRTPADMAPPVVESTHAGGFDFSDAAIGAGGAIGLLAIALAGAMTVRRRHTRPRSWTAVG